MSTRHSKASTAADLKHHRQILDAEDNLSIGEETDAELSPKAIAGQKGGLKGGPARKKALTPERRKEIAEEAAKTRWSKS